MEPPDASPFCCDGGGGRLSDSLSGGFVLSVAMGLVGGKTKCGLSTVLEGEAAIVMYVPPPVKQIIISDNQMLIHTTSKSIFLYVGKTSRKGRSFRVVQMTHHTQA